MQWCNQFLFLTVLIGVISIFPNSDAKFGVNIGICDPLRIPCKCGKTNDDAIVSVKQCTYHKKRFRFECRPCDGYDESDICQPFAECLTCNSDDKVCLSCPEGRFGSLCEGACNCGNGGVCNKDGTCTCPAGYYGPKCQLMIGCPTLSRPAFGDLSFDSDIIKLGTSASFRCNEGFKLDGQSTLYCLETQLWSSSVPQCLKMCPMPPSPSNGFVQGSAPDLVSGSSVVFTCQPGFALQGSATTKCLPDGSWSQEVPQCVKISYCEEPSHPENSERQMETGILGDFSQGTKIHYKCREGSQMLGSKTIECRENGKWTAAPPICISGKLCEDPGELKNGKRIIRSKIEGHFPPGSSIEYRCNPLFYLLGTTVITCNHEGKWNSERPDCMAFTTCQQPEEVSNLNMEIVPPHLIPRSVPVRRVSGSESVIGSRSFPRRRFNTTRLRVNPLQALNKSSVRAKRDVSPLPAGHHHVGSQAKFSCESRYYKLIGSHVRICQVNGKWGGTPATCIPVCGRNNAPKVPSITFGTPSEIGHWPWQVGISTLLFPEEADPLWFLTCGASVINERWVLTAAHCVTYEETNIVIPKEEIQLYFGKHYRNNSLDDKMVQTRNVSEIHIHPDYQPKSLDADIALIQVNKPIEFTSRVQAICLPEYRSDRSDERLKEGNKGMLTGWGETEQGGFSPVLRQVEIPVVNNRRCEQEYRNQSIHLALSWNTFCAGFDEGKQDSCTGDSGGPLVFPFDERRDHWVQEGIVSWGSKEGCGNAKQFSGFTRVQRFVEWIQQFI